LLSSQQHAELAQTESKYQRYDVPIKLSSTRSGPCENWSKLRRGPNAASDLLSRCKWTAPNYDPTQSFIECWSLAWWSSLDTFCTQYWNRIRYGRKTACFPDATGRPSSYPKGKLSSPSRGGSSSSGSWFGQTQPHVNRLSKETMR